MTQSVAYSAFRNNLKTWMRKANEDADTILVTNSDPADNVVVMGAADYESLMETLRIYENQQLHDKILRGMRQVAEDGTQVHQLAEE
ncbi:type II toxin-antitoxin system Phd/YefM family antitoxin [Bifidobacterium vespertilionis]|uniref:Antitoxin n=1 Tax=Bifidobacterium vespertilionis TaxID=2562524 RepID=A0A5J5E5Q9_9BIFI|nr:type II toxin-antitoxin system prevent-host-death family antitoxin [Bifidobacterium vespertilionis]KAA8822101.1 type II toxin-antitoxin system Phd/YefM family antitoxin [Bifidobacterium vespertilionis]KAA8824536.1 type II toxin-antitoxin system Phd/YefM family antitoxin [Bifidobacterium vespertilionis]